MISFRFEFFNSLKKIVKNILTVIFIHEKYIIL